MAAKDNLQPKLFDIPRDEPTPLSIDINPGTYVWHASYSAALPSKDRGENVALDYKNSDENMGHPLGFHSGTLQSALERHRHNVIPLADITGEYGVKSDGGEIWSDAAANNSIRATEAVARGENILYENDIEDAGSLSVRSPRQNIKTWSEQVRTDPSNSTYAERKAVRKGAELVYRSVTDWPKGTKPTGFPEGIEPPPTLGRFDGDRKFTPIKNTDEEDIVSLAVPHMVYPHKKAKKSKTDTNQMRFDL